MSPIPEIHLKPVCKQHGGEGPRLKSVSQFPLRQTWFTDTAGYRSRTYTPLSSSLACWSHTATFLPCHGRLHCTIIVGDFTDSA